MGEVLPSYADVICPPEYVAIPEIAGFLYGSLDNLNPWGIPPELQIEKLYDILDSSMQELFKTSKTVGLLNNKVHDSILGLVENGLVRGDIQSIAWVPDEQIIVGLTPSFWAIKQRSLLTPLEAENYPIKLALNDEPVVLLSFIIPLPLGVPFVSKQELTIFLNAERAPGFRVGTPTRWEDWKIARQNSDQIFKNKNRDRSLRKRGRKFEYDWTLMWHELVRQASSGNIDGWTISYASRWLAEWLSLQTGIYPDERTIRRLLVGLFPNEMERDR